MKSTKKQFGFGQERVALVIDDFLVIRRNHSILLQKMGFTVHEAVNGREGLDLLAKHGADHFSLIIVDLFMPEMSGEEFILEVKKHYSEDLPYLIVCSSEAELPNVKKIASYGIDDYLVKPIDYQAFIKKLNKLFPDLQYGK